MSINWLLLLPVRCRPQAGLVDRYLIIAAMNDIPATLVLTKPGLMTIKDTLNSIAH